MRQRGLTLLEALFLVAIVFLLVTLLGVTRLSSHRHQNGAKCSNNLKQIGMAALQYSDDKRFFPHRAGLHELDGGIESDTAARCVRTLAYYNYDDNPDGFICPSSPDQARSLDDAAKTDIRYFHWAASKGPPSGLPECPLYSTGDAGDRPLIEMTDLSYGWTRQAVGLNAAASTPVAGDKARIVPDRELEPLRQGNMAGNHKDAINVVYVDAHVVRVKPDPDTGLTTHNIADTTKDGGFLGVLGD
jgi:hypothetical protein